MADPATTGWAVIVPGSLTASRKPHIVVELGDDVTEERAWTVALGWPDQDDIRVAKERGARSFRCKLVEIDT